MRIVTLTILTVIALAVAIPAAAKDLVQEDTGLRFPDTITLERGGDPVTLKATGVSLREATFMKVNVYAVVSYVEASVDLGKDPGATLIAAEAAKRIDMKFVRDVSADKITSAYREGIEKNLGKDEVAALSAELDRFRGFFTEDLKDGDEMRLTYIPGIGLEVWLNDRVLGTEASAPLARAVWSIWFGKKPVSGGMKKEMLSLGS